MGKDSLSAVGTGLHVAQEHGAGWSQLLQGKSEQRSAACRLCGTILCWLLPNCVKLTLITFRELINNVSENHSPVTAKVALDVGS